LEVRNNPAKQKKVDNIYRQCTEDAVSWI